MSASRAAVPIFLVSAPGTDASVLARSLGAAADATVATLEVDEAKDAAVSTIATSLPQARFVFVADDPLMAAPPQLTELGQERWLRVELPAVIENPRRELQRVCAFAGIAYDQALLGPVEALRRAASADVPEGRSPFASVSTASMAQALAQGASSLLISTYQSGRLVCARAREDGMNTHFREFDKPMGIATAPGRIALGTRTEVWDLRDMPEAAPKIEPVGSHDACYLPRNRHVTGDIAVHDLAFAGGELWLAATAFSCLATLDASHSFVPRWAPPFITQLAPEDRCHLNGLAVVGDSVSYVTALGTGDQAGSWRVGKADGGVLMDVASSEVVLAGLSMPHSPRWYRNRLWLLESGKGSLCVADLAAGRIRRWPSCRVSRAAWRLSAIRPSSGSRRSASHPPSAICRSRTA